MSKIFQREWGFVRRGRTRAAWLATLLLLSAAQLSLAADDPRAAAVQLSDQAFALLGSLGSSDAAKPLLGPIAGFAGDAQTLSGALGRDDRAAAGQAIAELQSDRNAIDNAAKAYPGIIDRAKWESLEQQLDALTRAIPPSAAPSAASVSAPASAGGGVEPGVAQLKVKIESLGVDADQITHVKGFLAGRDLQSAGVFVGGRELRPLDIGPPPERGSLRVKFDIQLAELEPGTVIRVYDKFGHSAEAQISSAGVVEPRGSVGRAEPEDSSGVIVNRGDETEPAESPSEAGGASTAEIPSAEPPSPSKRHMHSHIGGLSDVQIHIDQTVLIDPTLREYEIGGRIAGSRVERAAIYVDGNFTQEIQLASPDSFGVRAFNQTFALSGLQATIRVYGAGDDYVENSIRTPAAAPGAVVVPGYAYGVTPYAVTPYGFRANPYSANPYGRLLSPYGPTIPGYGGYTTNPNINVAPVYPYGYPYVGSAPTVR